METKSKIVNRAATARPAAAPLVQRATGGPGGTAVRVQTALRVSSPADPAEREAESTAKRIMRMALADRLPGPSGPPVAPGRRRPVARARGAAQGRGAPRRGRQRRGGDPGQRHRRPGRSRPACGGSWSRGFGADFGDVRIHTDETRGEPRATSSAPAPSPRQPRLLRPRPVPARDRRGARADRARAHPHDPAGRRVAQRQPRQPGVRQPRRQPSRSSASASATRSTTSPTRRTYIPGFRMFTLMLGVNPINMSRVDRTAANILRALDRVHSRRRADHPGARQLRRLRQGRRLGGAADRHARHDIGGDDLGRRSDEFLDSLGWTRHLPPRATCGTARSGSSPIRSTGSSPSATASSPGSSSSSRRRSCGRSPALAEGTRGYDLLKAVLGQDPITGEPVPRTADTLIGGFMKLIGQEEVWENIKTAQRGAARLGAGSRARSSGLMALRAGDPGAVHRRRCSSLEHRRHRRCCRARSRRSRGVFVGFAVRVRQRGRPSRCSSLLEIIFEVRRARR